MKGIILFGHGARSAEYAQPFERIRDAMMARQPDALIELGFLELTRPSLDESIACLVSRGVRRISVVPIFIGPGRHVLKDLPQLAANAMDRFPDLAITLAPPVGESVAVVDAMARFALDA
ncbi:MAG: CbiX/SirB N-terminal domain-containing protein [Rhodocyclaceae bacterium]|jgi:sirohydrochlorin cobaltochelatase|nr:CbiX/SirB N-terminal domain-containing protein [Rhodocyclaceae bacterium]MBK6555239.1 CbiX/SirB N-terminal domain-containing protein [Rhodocyclaceae bacterium]MBK9309478.1 CbiX/SirB N-terminal domain-containing protein [Rhodocyclaceae bacterium]MBK9955430.1 CbiX/SirB N-terminal domain-containing protein [Rhodocyclaceae bacterium]